MLRTNKISDLIHFSNHNLNLPFTKVDIHFTRTEEKIFQEKRILSRLVNWENKSEYLINNHRSSLSKACTFLKKNRIDLTNDRFAILQGEIEQISLLRCKGRKDCNTGFIEYLENIIGTGRYVKYLNKLQQELAHVSKQRKSIFQSLMSLDREKQRLCGSKDRADAYINAKYKLLSTSSIYLLSKLKQVYMNSARCNSAFLKHVSLIVLIEKQFRNRNIENMIYAERQALLTLNYEINRLWLRNIKENIDEYEKKDVRIHSETQFSEKQKLKLSVDTFCNYKTMRELRRETIFLFVCALVNHQKTKNSLRYTLKIKKNFLNGNE